MWKELGGHPPTVEVTIMTNSEFIIAEPVDRHTWGNTHWVYHHSLGWHERDKPWFKPL